MITIQLKECCYICVCPKLEVDEYTINYNNGALDTNAVVSCGHSHVCEMYRHCVDHDMNKYKIKDYSTTAAEN